MSLALFGFDELEAKLYFLNTGKHINESPPIRPPRRRRDSQSSSSSGTMEEDDNEAQMEEEIGEGAEEPANTDAKITEDISDVDSVSVNGDGDNDADMEAALPEPKPNEIFASVEDKSISDFADRMVTEENVVSGECVEGQEEGVLLDMTAPASQVTTLLEVAKEEVVHPSGEANLAITTSLPGADENVREQVAPSETILLSTEDDADTKEVPKAQEKSDTLEMEDNPVAVESSCNPINEDPAAASNNNTDDFSLESLEVSNGHREHHSADVIEEMQRSCKQCYVRLRKISSPPATQTSEELLKSCKACYVRLNKLHLNDLLLSCRQCSVVVPKLVQRC